MAPSVLFVETHVVFSTILFLFANRIRIISWEVDLDLFKLECTGRTSYATKAVKFWSIQTARIEKVNFLVALEAVAIFGVSTKRVR